MHHAKHPSERQARRRRRSLDCIKTLLDIIEAPERCIELFAGIVGKARAVTRDETVFAAPPLTEDIDRIVKLSRADPGQRNLEGKVHPLNLT